MSLNSAINLHERGDLERASLAYRDILKRDPLCHQALHGLGVIMYQRGRLEPALALIEQALKLNTTQADYYFHNAEILCDLGRFDEAVISYRRAITLKNTEADYHFGLANVLAQSGDIDASIVAYRSAERHAPRDAGILMGLGNALADKGDLPAAKERMQRAVTIEPVNANAHHNLSLVLNDSGDRAGALKHAQLARHLVPDNREVLVNLGRLLIKNGDRFAGLDCFQRAFDLCDNNAGLLARIASILSRADEPRAALRGYRRASELEPQVIRYRLGVARCLIRLQRFVEAEAESERTLEIDSDCCEACVNLAVCLQIRGRFDGAREILRQVLKVRPSLTQAIDLLVSTGGDAVSDSEIQQWLSLKEDESLGDEAECHLYFALGKIFEQRGEFWAAFEHFRRANALKSRHYPFDAIRHTAYIDRIVATFDETFFAARKGYGSQREGLIFIVGMPRSGTTLLEQILASHPRVVALGEHLAMREIVRELPQAIGSDQSVPECCGAIDHTMAEQLAQRYVNTLPGGVRDSGYVSDKMLGNFMRLGVIALLFPQARIVHCMRNPLDTCMSCFTQNFAHGLRFTSDLTHLADFYRDYRRLMAHWRQVLPLPLHELSYETLVTKPEQTTRELIRFCNLQWNDRCLVPHLADREVATASSWQARQPIYQRSMGRWRHYEAYLGELIDGLARAGYTDA